MRIIENYIILLLITEIFLILVSYNVTRNFLSPALLSYVMFFLSTLCVVYNIKLWDVHFSLKAYFVLVAGFLAMFFPEFIIIHIRTRRGLCIEEKHKYDSSKIKAIHPSMNVNIVIIIFCVIITIAYVFLVYRRGKILGGEGLNIIGLAKNNSGGTKKIEGLISRILMIFFYVNSFSVMHNLVLLKEKIRKQVLLLVPILCFSIVNFFNGNRLMMVKGILAIYTCTIIFISYRGENTKKDYSKIFKKFILAGIVLLVVFYCSRLITKVNSSTGGRSFIDYITYYVGSPVCLFSKYLDNPNLVHAKNNLFGETTFASLWMQLGYTPIFENNFIYVGGKSNFAGNAMTWFQNAINDYGFFGMIIFTTLIYGVFDCVLYIGVLKKRRISSVVFMMYFDFVIVMSFYYAQTMWAVSLMNFIYFIIIILGVRYLKRFKI